MAIDRKTIKWVANLAKLTLTEDEERLMERQLGRILDYMDILSELDLTDVRPTAHTLGFTNVVREDNPEDSFETHVLEKLAPDWKNGYVVVPRVVA